MKDPPLTIKSSKIIQPVCNVRSFSCRPIIRCFWSFEASIKKRRETRRNLMIRFTVFVNSPPNIFLLHAFSNPSRLASRAAILNSIFCNACVPMMSNCLRVKRRLITGLKNFESRNVTVGQFACIREINIFCTENDFYADSRKALKVQGGRLYLG